MLAWTGRFGVLSSCFLATLAHAAPITYFFSATGSGSISGAAFTNTPYVIALSGDTEAIDLTFAGLAEWRNAVTGTIQVKGLRKATIAVPILIATGCGTGGGFVGIEKTPGGGPFFAYIYAVQGAPTVACPLQSAVSASDLTASVAGFANIPLSRGSATLASSSPVTYQATLCTLAPRHCRKQRNRIQRTLLDAQVE